MEPQQIEQPIKSLAKSEDIKQSIALEDAPIKSEDSKVELVKSEINAPIRKWPCLAERLNELGDYFKKLENACPDILEQKKYTLLRIDGSCFSTFTRPFDKPFDNVLAESMILSTRDLMKKFNGMLAYTQSDEISMLISPEHQLAYSGRSKKYITLAASYFAARFNYYLQGTAQGTMRNMARGIVRTIPVDSRKYHNMTSGEACFDCRALQVDSLDDVKKAFEWRMLDAYRNGVSALGRDSFGTKGVIKIGTGQLIKKLIANNFDVTQSPKHLLHGTFIKKIKVPAIIKNQKTGEETEVLKTDYEVSPGREVNEFGIQLDLLQMLL